ncbi:uncharacterized protein LOC106156230 isoform X1 [Lingula anatina]|uniref:Uncharacterized protein LOC106156230 isoform X1 n=2 Tax=Lingula anatina TaxID=7574 RepID=A0A1S3HL42_LINAN|nr:uncharacterized protein LOC106156230 isoform X1 [Lingula anatina]XP_013386816.1 uncharacterized protein LOC106156230 isoform X1 [Lingula anatina]XP_013386817.1 uncharacterized protein LOC106156230 isoform X1 [Lingula anatina]XP_013386818.1 uncharacterized protein LOC106156230 isoform X1 [Lingula anatina]XP_013386819.1 uncharacterized protein LOC106156230 isoform X1 [Lingula anatina]XP_013386821.1 uncharacterized protein LOC106156230 isoform X1 [Lingula anatina]XP_013386822.1 uncharacterize|eukprot:XP_013386815.1 uncharacterized protein LOC106156230 isoform X1 [Lingula anatina]
MGNSPSQNEALWAAIARQPSRVQQVLNQGRADLTDMSPPPKYNLQGSPLQAAQKMKEKYMSTSMTNLVHVYDQIIHLLEGAMDEQIVEAVKNGNKEQLVKLHRAGGDIYQVSKPTVSGLKMGLLELAATLPGDRNNIVEYLLREDPQNAKAITFFATGQVGLNTVAQNAGNPNVANAIYYAMGRALIHASQNGQLDSDAVTRLVKVFGVDVDFLDEEQDRSTPLMYAVLGKKTDLVKLLVDEGADPEMQNDRGQTAMGICRHSETRNAQIETILKNAITNKHIRRAVMESGMTLTVADLQESCPQGFNVNAADKEGNSLLCLTIIHNCSMDILTTLVTSYSANINLQNHSGEGPVELAVKSDRPDVLEMLLQHGADMKRPRWTLLDFAKDHNASEEVCAVIKTEANARLWRSVDQGKEDNLKESLLVGADINFCYHSDDHRNVINGWTPLHLAVDRENVDILKLLCEMKAEINKGEEKGGKPPLAFAIERGNFQMVQLLHRFGADIHRQCNHGNTPLIYSAIGGHVPILHFLLKLGADENKRNVEGKSALDEAIRGNQDDIVNTLNELDYDHSLPGKTERGHSKPSDSVDVCPPVTVPETRIMTLPMIPLESGFRKVAGGLLGTTLNEKLMEAAQRGDYDNAALAVADGADIRYRNKRGHTAMDEARLSAEKFRQEANRQTDPNMKTYKIGQYNMCLQCSDQLVRILVNGQLIKAVQRETLERVQTLHKVGGNINQCSDTMPLGLVGILCQSQDKPEILNYLVECDQTNLRTLCVTDQNQKSPLDYAKERGFTRLETYIVGRLGVWLKAAVKQNKAEDCMVLLQRGAAPEIADGNTSSNIAQAVLQGNLEMVKHLVTYGADPGWIFPDGKSTVTVAQEKWSFDIAEYLKQKMKNKQVREAARQGDVEAVMRLHREGADIDELTYNGNTATRIAVQSGNLRLVHYLLSHGASLFHRFNATTLVKEAADLGNTDMEEYIRHVGQRRYHEALRHGDINELKAIFSLQGIDLTTLPDGETAGTLVTKNNHGEEVARLLKEHGVEFVTKNDKGEFPLGLAAQNGDFALVKFLVRECGVNKAEVDRHGKTAAQIAREAGYTQTAHFLETDELPEEEEIEKEKPKFSDAELINATKKGNMKIIDAFIKEKYQNRLRKIKICKQLIYEATRRNAQEILKKLKDHLKELEEDTSERKLTGSRNVQKILDSFLNGMVKRFANVDNIDDIEDESYLSNISQKVKTKTTMLYTDPTEAIADDAEKLFDRADDVNQKMANLEVTRESIYTEITDREDKAKKAVTPRERLKHGAELELLKEEMVQAHAMQAILTIEQAAIKRKQQANERFKENKGEKYVFFETFRSKLHTWLARCEAACGGIKTKDGGSTVELFGEDEEVADPEKHSNQSIVAALNAMKSRATRAIQFTRPKGKKEAKQIDFVVVMAELDRTITNAAFYLTLCYAEQIKILQGAAALNINPQDRAHNPVEYLSDYCVSHIMTSFKRGEFGNPNSPPIQLDMVLYETIFLTTFANPDNVHQTLIERASRCEVTIHQPRGARRCPLLYLLQKGGLRSKGGTSYTIDDTDTNNCGFYWVTDSLAANVEKFWRENGVAFDKTEGGDECIDLYRADESETSTAQQILEWRVDTYLQTEGITRQNLENSAVSAEERAKDWFYTIKDDVDTWKAQNKTWEEKMEEKFKDFQTMVNAENSQHKNETRSNIKKAETDQNNFKKTMASNFAQHKTDVQNMYENHKAALTTLHQEGMEMLQTQFETFKNQQKMRQEDFEKEMRRDFGFLSDELRQQVNEATSRMEQDIHSLGQELQSRMKVVEEQQQEMHQMVQKTLQDMRAEQRKAENEMHNKYTEHDTSIKLALDRQTKTNEKMEKARNAWEKTADGKLRSFDDKLSRWNKNLETKIQKVQEAIKHNIDMALKNAGNNFNG